MKKLFQYAVLVHSYDKEGDYLDSKTIIQPTYTLAKSEKDLVFKVTREIPEEFASDPDNVEILIRNF